MVVTAKGYEMFFWRVRCDKDILKFDDDDDHMTMNIQFDIVTYV